jgi:hypothetical protein
LDTSLLTLLEEVNYVFKCFLRKERKHFGKGLDKDYYLKSASSDQLLFLKTSGSNVLGAI